MYTDNTEGTRCLIMKIIALLNRQSAVRAERRRITQTWRRSDHCKRSHCELSSFPPPAFIYTKYDQDPPKESISRTFFVFASHSSHNRSWKSCVGVQQTASQGRAGSRLGSSSENQKVSEPKLSNVRSIWERLSARRKVTLKTSVNLYWMWTKWTWTNNWGKKMGRDYWFFHFVFVPGKIDSGRSFCVWAQSGEGGHKGISVGHSGIAFLRCSFLEWISYSAGIFIVANSIRFLWPGLHSETFDVWGAGKEGGGKVRFDHFHHLNKKIIQLITVTHFIRGGQNRRIGSM